MGKREYYRFLYESTSLGFNVHYKNIQKRRSKGKGDTVSKDFDWRLSVKGVLSKYFFRF